MAYADSKPHDRLWPKVTLATVLKEREDLLVELAATKKFAIDVLREHLAARPGRTLLRNVADNVGSLELDESKSQSICQYLTWLKGAARELNLRSIGDLAEKLEPFNSNKAISNVNRNRRSRTYDYGLVARRGRNPWSEIRVKTVRTVLARVDALVTEIQEGFGGQQFGEVLDYREVLDYVERRIQHSPSALNIAELAKPTARIIAVALSTNAKYVEIYERMWGDDQERNHICSRQMARAHVNERHRRAAEGGSSGGGGSWAEVIDTISDAIVSSRAAGIPVLLAINAPLGWPVAMTEALATHEAGAAIPDLDSKVDLYVDDQDSGDKLNFDHTETISEKRWRHERNRFFRRRTEQVVREVRASKVGFGPSGLDVGADKSARTAHQALRLLSVVRARTKLPIPVITNRCGPIVRTSAIEVYTMWRRTGAGEGDSQQVGAGIENPVETSPDVSTMWRRTGAGEADGQQVGAGTENPTETSPRPSSSVASPPSTTHTKPPFRTAPANAEIAAHAAVAFLEGRVSCPRDHGVDEDVARREGWIWG